MYETVDRIYKHSGQGHAHLLPQAPEHQLGAYLSFALPLTYGADVLHGVVHGAHMLPYVLDLFILAA
ncbi:MAG: hypothetical protein ACLFQG_09535, partial [Desulfovermiculus sp.]